MLFTVKVFHCLKTVKLWRTGQHLHQRSSMTFVDFDAFKLIVIGSKVHSSEGIRGHTEKALHYFHGKESLSVLYVFSRYHVHCFSSYFRWRRNHLKLIEMVLRSFEWLRTLLKLDWKLLELNSVRLRISFVIIAYCVIRNSLKAWRQSKSLNVICR